MLKSYIVPQFTCLNHDYTSTLLCCIAVLFSQSNWDSDDDDDEEDDDIEAQAAVKTAAVTGISPRQVNLMQGQILQFTAVRVIIFASVTELFCL